MRGNGVKQVQEIGAQILIPHGFWHSSNPQILSRLPVLQVFLLYLELGDCGLELHCPPQERGYIEPVSQILFLVYQYALLAAPSPLSVPEQSSQSPV